MALRRFVEDYQVMSGDDPGTEPQSGRWRLIDDMDERWIQVREVVIDDWRFEPTDQWGGPPIVEALHRTAKAHRIEAEAFRLVFRDFGGDGPAELTGLPGAAKQASIGGPFPAKGTTADAHAEPTALARRPAHRVPSLLHRADVCDLQCHGRRVLGPAGPAHRHRDAGRRGPGRPPPSRPGLPLLRHRPLVD